MPGAARILASGNACAGSRAVIMSPGVRLQQKRVKLLMCHPRKNRDPI